MADVVFNIALGRVVAYAELVAANDALIGVPLETAGLEADATLRDHDTLAALLAGTSNEQTTLGRKTISASVTITIDDTNNWVDVDMPDQTYSASAGNAISKFVIAYDGDTTGGADTAIVPLTAHDAVATPDGTDLVLVVPAAGFFRAA